LLADALAFCECRVTEDVTAATHRVFLAEVTRAVAAATSDQACDARCAIELGVAALTVGRVTPEEVAELRRLMGQTEPLVAEWRFVDVDANVTLNAGFHTALVGLARNPALLDACERLGSPA
jgi:DNA-binding GntR family transcriptional regulator